MVRLQIFQAGASGEPNTTSADVDYKFRSPRLREMNARFREALAENDRTMPVERFAPLGEIAVSIQF